MYEGGYFLGFLHLCFKCKVAPCLFWEGEGGEVDGVIFYFGVGC